MNEWKKKKKNQRDYDSDFDFNFDGKPIEACDGWQIIVSCVCVCVCAISCHICTGINMLNAYWKLIWPGNAI